MARFLLLVCLTVGIVFLTQGEPTEDEYSITIRMPDVVSDRADALICTSVKLDPKESYLIRFKPHASKETAHHMMVFGCHQPGSTAESWACFNSDGQDENSVCRDGEREILFAWALDAPDKSLPEGVGFRVSGNTTITHLVVQLHYATEFAPGVTDNSGITLEFTNKRPPQLANYYVLGNWGIIPPQLKEFHMEAACEYRRNYTIYPIGFRTHAHNLGVVTSGYRIRNGKWTEIGRMSPQLPQTFYDITHPGMDIRKGDILAHRCTMNSMARDTVTNIGSTNHDEMCNFYIMYSTYDDELIGTDFCFKDSQYYQWLDDFSPDVIPKDASSLDGIPGASEVLEKFNGKGDQGHGMHG
ncbi:peptidylglycine alpha-hydroxylating monooxygenase-like [Physella acuta]|uniref:peptidylglycine alpha-hydroxylating monooxygenase-like n=1 Tax=Physella acuta TaxID=109671 RepID=UPI0027DC478B|nr:peptidylglycine alpha-hydroxylating monooxygenase-like [Physella acuta]